MLGINKITVSDQLDDRGNNVYVVEVDYYFETTRNEFGLPSLDLSRDTRMSAQIERRTTVVSNQPLIYPTFLGTELNPDIKKTKTGTGYRYPFYTKFNIDKEEDLSEYNLVLILYRGKVRKPQTVVQLFANGDLLINNETNVSIEDKRTNFYNNIFNFDLFTIGSTPNNSSVSDLMISYGKDASVRGMFIFDKQKFISNNSDFGKILTNPKIPEDVRRQIMNKSLVDNLEISRNRLSYIRNFQNNPHYADKNEAPQTVAKAKDSTSGILQSFTPTAPSLIATGTSLTGSPLPTAQLVDIGELPGLELSDISFEKLVAFNDFNTSQGGTYQYSLQMRIQDGTLGWLVDTLDLLTNIQSSLNGSVTKKKITNIVWVIFALNEDINMTQKSLIDYLMNMVKHEGSLLLLKSYMTNLINKISNLIGKAGVVSQTNSAYSKAYSKNNSELFFLTFNKMFTTTANFDDAIDLNYDYMGLKANSDVGATMVSKGIIEDRSNREITKLLLSTPPDGYANLSKNIFTDVFGYSDASDDALRLAYFNFQPNLYAYFSPVEIDNVALTLSNTFNFGFMADIHFRQKYDDNLTPELSLSYYLQDNGISLDKDFFFEDPPLKDSSSNPTYFPANDIFSNNDKVNEPPISTEDYKSGIVVSPMKEVSRSFASALLRNQENWNLSREDFNLTNKTNLISYVAPTLSLTAPDAPDLVAQKELSIVTEMPNQIRAIFASPSDKCVNRWLSPSMDGDYIYSPTTYYTIKQNYMNLVKIEYLEGFEKDSNGLPDVRNPIFKKLIDLNGTGKIICRASIYSDARFRIGVGFDRIAYPDKYFILDLTE